MKKSDLASRMKAYESCYDIRIPARTYVIVRLDGKNFSKYTQMFEKPFDDKVSNYIIWRQQDCTRNSVSMAASANFSHKLLENKSSEEKQEMLFTEKGINWNDYLPKYKRGTIIKKQLVFIDGQNGEPLQRNKWLPDYNTPIFTQEKEYLYKLIPTIQI